MSIELNKIYTSDTLTFLKEMPDDYVSCIVTSCPYWGLRDYGIDGQLGLEPTLELYLNHMLEITGELKRVLRKDGVMWWNHGDSYGGSGGDHKDHHNYQGTGFQGEIKRGCRSNKLTPKCLALQNHRLILKMIDSQGWILRNTVIWHKSNPMPSSVKDRLSNTYEPVYMLVKNKKYWFDLDSIRKPHETPLHNPGNIFHSDKVAGPQDRGGKSQWEDTDRVWGNPSGKNPGDVFKIPTQPYPEAHFATFPEKLITPMIKSSCPEWVCSECGKARVRVTKTKYVPHRKAKNLSKTRAKSIGKTHCAMDSQGKVCNAEHQTTGWTKCNCNKPFKPGICLDPFIGSGTTALVALKLRRSFIGIDIKQEYVDMANKRILEVQVKMI